MVYSPGIDWAEKIMYEFPEIEWGIEDADEGDIGFYASIQDGYLPNCYQSYNDAAKAIYQLLTTDY